MLTIEMPNKWQQIIETEKHFIALPTGRVSGKTKNSVLLATLLMLEFPYCDILVSRSSYGSIENSTYAEFESAFFELSEQIRKQFTFKKTPLSIERRGNSGTIYFMGIGGSNTDRTKGFHPKHKLIFVISEETQELRDRNSYNQFEASIRRSFGNRLLFPAAFLLFPFGLFSSGGRFCRTNSPRRRRLCLQAC